MEAVPSFHRAFGDKRRPAAQFVRWSPFWKKLQTSVDVGGGGGGGVRRLGGVWGEQGGERVGTGEGQLSGYHIVCVIKGWYKKIAGNLSMYSIVILEF